MAVISGELKQATIATCPGCSNACELKIPIPKLNIDLPIIEIPKIPTVEELLAMLPELPTLPTVEELQALALKYAQEFAGTLPSLSNPPWVAERIYEYNTTTKKGTFIDVKRPEPVPEEQGFRSSVITYMAINAGKGGTTEPTWGAKEVRDGEVTLKYIKESFGLAGKCPNSQKKVKSSAT